MIEDIMLAGGLSVSVILSLAVAQAIHREAQVKRAKMTRILGPIQEQMHIAQFRHAMNDITRDAFVAMAEQAAVEPVKAEDLEAEFNEWRENLYESEE